LVLFIVFPILITFFTPLYIPGAFANPVATPCPIPLESLESPPRTLIPCPIKLAPVPKAAPYIDCPKFYPNP
jgi:hypothetical protein